MKYALLAVVIFNMQQPAFAATCSCAGVPLLAVIDTSATEKGQLFLSYSAEYHQINDLVSGSDDVNDETGRDRNTFSQVLSASYALTDHWAVSALVSYVKHKRTIGASFLGTTTTSGISDSVILARYTPFSITPFSRHGASLGLGVRIPTGEDDFGDTFVLSEDMQPSTGAFGEILWASYSYAFNQAATLQLNTSANYTFNEENDRQYAFGNEFNFASGISHSVGAKFGYSAALRYRTTTADSRFGFSIPNTGGQWLDFVPAVRYSVTDHLSLGLSGRIPVARKLNGVLQFTTSYSVAFSASYGF
ncbi:transporter [Pseudomonadota bacterium]